ncbi:MAG: type II toxin-antitoxin system prevent-host-death family antitoxin [Phycisphaeraceae bacterium]
MRSVNVREARQSLSDLVDAAEHGQSVLITRHGKQVARIGPAGLVQATPLPDLGAFRESIRQAAGGEPLSKVVCETRKQARS